jgi:ABC-type Fe3+-siderophore transport system permease subunit
MRKLFALLVALSIPATALAQEAAKGTAPSAGPQNVSLSLAFALSLAMILYGISKGLLRDRKPYDGLAGVPKNETPFSLSRIQMTAWTILIIGAFCFLALNGDVNQIVIPNSILILMGIASGTSLGAAIVDNQTPDGSAINQAYKTALEAQKKLTEEPDNAAAKTALETARASLYKLAPKSEKFLNDILSDANGYNLHRVQMAAWTLVVIAIFIGSVFSEGRMPDLNPTLLALMGISNGVYLGFKIPEVQSKG